ncbi:MAG: ATP-grasp domain-containing protein [Candidatus Andersenbacteria bacterium]|nr:ATP-grasp domain-containing protein [bacterium]MDZ4225277.1 ATP-grasp domain-containing protein [Candidatus Andersenbacteria bacterium]
MKEIGPSTKLIVEEAQRRGINALSFYPANPNFVCLETSGHHEYIYYSYNNRLGKVTASIFLNKIMTTTLLRRGGFTVPEEIFTDSEEEIIDFLKKHKRIVIKPADLLWGKGITVGISQPEQVVPALAYAREFNSRQNKIICQEHIDGYEYRVLVIDQKHIFTARRIPAHVVGDGTKTVGQLVEAWNDLVSDDRKLKQTDLADRLLEEQGAGWDAVPGAGRLVYLSNVANAHAGGTVVDATDEIGDEVKAGALAVAKHFDTSVVGIDCITSDIRKKMGCIIELNSTPDITLHHNPTKGKPRDVAGAIVDMLFPETVGK